MYTEYDPGQCARFRLGAAAAAAIRIACITACAACTTTCAAAVAAAAAGGGQGPKRVRSGEPRALHEKVAVEEPPASARGGRPNKRAQALHLLRERPPGELQDAAVTKL